jgi:exosortase/archaeosortase family protein
MKKIPKPIIQYLLRYVLFVAALFGSTELFRRIYTIQNAPFDVAFVYFPLFFVAVTGIFFILNYDKLKQYLFEQNWYHTFGFVMFAFWNIAVYTILKYNIAPVFAINSSTTYLLLLGLYYFIGSSVLALGVFGLPFFRIFARELLLLAVVVIPYFSLTFVLRSYSDLFSNLQVQANTFLMGLLGFDFSYAIGGGDPRLALSNFKVIIGAPCSGVDSLLLFTGLYWFIGLLDFAKYNTKKLLLLFPIGLIGVYAMSILRIFLLMLVGAFYSPKLALNSFHTNAGWIIFVIYFLGFIYFALPWMKK